MAFRLSPTGLAANGYGAFTGKLISTTLTGAATATQAGTVNVITTTVRRTALGPHGLVTKTRNFSKQVNQEANATITGAAIEGQWATPDLADAAIYPDAVEFGANAGSVASDNAFAQTAAIAAAAGTVTVSVDIDAAITGAVISPAIGTITGVVGSSGTDISPTPMGAAIGADAGTLTPTYDWIQSVTGAQINALQAEPGIDTSAPVSVTIAGAEISSDAADPALAGPHVTVNLVGAKITCHGTKTWIAPSHGRQRRRYVIEIDGEPIIVHSVAEAQALLAEVAELAETAAERDITIDTTPAIPVIKVNTGTGKASQSKAIQEATRTTQRAVNKAYEEVKKRRRIDAEISKLLIAKIESEEEEEETIIALLLA